MSNFSDIGNLMHLYLDEIEPGDGTSASEFLINASASLLTSKGGRNWIPVIVMETDRDRYKVVGNSFIYAIAKRAGLERVWCIIVDDSTDTTDIVKVLAGEKIPQINLSKATRDEIMQGLQYLIEQPNSILKGVNLATATNRIDQALRQYWETFDPIANLKCGITKGKKLDALKQVFYLVPEPMPVEKIDPQVDKITDSHLLSKLTKPVLIEMAKKQGLVGISKLKKDDLIRMLSKC